MSEDEEYEKKYDEEEYEEEEYKEVDYEELEHEQEERELNQELEFAEDKSSYISMEQEWRDFKDSGDASKSRVGIAHASDVDIGLSTIIEGRKESRLEQMLHTPEDNFRSIAMKTIKKFNLSNEIYTDSLRVMQMINLQNRRLKYISPQLVIFALLIIEEDKITLDLLKKYNIFKESNIEEKTKNKIDILRYAFFIKELKLKHI